MFFLGGSRPGEASGSSYPRSDQGDAILPPGSLRVTPESLPEGRTPQLCPRQRRRGREGRVACPVPLHRSVKPFSAQIKGLHPKMLIILLADQIRELEFFCFGKKESAALIQKQNRHQKNQDPIADFQSALPCLPSTGCLLSFGEQEPEPDP